MTNRREPKWFTQWLAQRDIEEEDAVNNDFFSKWMMADGFISTVEIMNAGVGGSSLTESRGLRDKLWGAIETAYAANEPWIRGEGRALDNGPMWLQLDPRAAALWLLSHPTYRHLVPPAWARVLRDAKATPEERTASEKPAGRARGPKPKTRERVAEAMRGMTRDKIGQDELRAMKQERMRAVFGASRETCVRAREAVLSEVVGVTNAAK